jgi:hypothetical protein
MDLPQMFMTRPHTLDLEPCVGMPEFDCKAVGNGKGRNVFVGLYFILHVESSIDML